MKQLIKYFFISLLMLSSVISSVPAQFNNQLASPFTVSKVEDIAFVKNRPLVVALESEDPAILKNFKKYPKDLQKYKDEIATKNQELREAITEFWTFTERLPQFLNMEEALTLRKAGKAIVLRANGHGFDYYRRNAQYIRSYGSNLDEMQARRIANLPPINKGINALNPGMYRKSNEASYLELLVSQKERGLVTVYLPADTTSKIDFVYGIQQMQYVLNYLQEGKDIRKFKAQLHQNHKELKDKILLIAREDLDQKITEADIKKIYPYPFEICDREKIEQAILSKSPNYAYVQLVISFRNRENLINHYISGTEDGKLYAAYMPDPRLQVTEYYQQTPTIAKKHIKFYTRPRYQ